MSNVVFHSSSVSPRYWQSRELLTDCNIAFRSEFIILLLLAKDNASVPATLEITWLGKIQKVGLPWCSDQTWSEIFKLLVISTKTDMNF